MSIIAIIPSRYTSNRFLGKPLALINGKPMILWVYERVSKSLYIDDVYIATDSEKINKIVCDYGGKTIITSSGHASGSDRVAEAADIIGLHNDDIVINVQGDQPFVDYRSFRLLVDPFFKMEKLNMATLAFCINDSKIINNPKDVKVIFDIDGFALYFSRYLIPYNRDKIVNYPVYKHLGFYAYKKRFLDLYRNLPVGKLEKLEKLEQLRPMEYGYKVLVIVSPYDSPEIDELTDILNLR